MVSALFFHEIIDSTDFFGILQDVAVADEKYLNHNIFLSQNAQKCRVLARFAGLYFLVLSPLLYYTFCKIGQIVANHIPHS